MTNLLILPNYLEVCTNLDVSRNVDRFRYNHKGHAFVYGIMCHAEDMIYIGSTWNSVRRFRQHLITGHTSNPALQAAIAKHGLQAFSIYVFEYISLEGIDKIERKVMITALEQKYIDLLPSDKQYNLINSYSKRVK